MPFGVRSPAPLLTQRKASPGPDGANRWPARFRELRRDRCIMVPPRSLSINPAQARMAHRIFTDAHSVTWLVLAVYPNADERRMERDRRQHDVPVDPDRRRAVDRRQRVRREMERGWLVFKTDNGRRRLTPIVDGWDSCPVEELEKMCRLATPAKRRGDPLNASIAGREAPPGLADPQRGPVSASGGAPSPL